MTVVCTVARILALLHNEFCIWCSCIKNKLVSLCAFKDYHSESATLTTKTVKGSVQVKLCHSITRHDGDSMNRLLPLGVNILSENSRWSRRNHFGFITSNKQIWWLCICSMLWIWACTVRVRQFYLHLGLQKRSASPSTSCKAPTLHHIFTYHNPLEIINWGTMESVRQVNHRRPSVATNHSFFLHLSYPFLAKLSYCQSFQSTAIFVTRA